MTDYVQVPREAIERMLDQLYESSNQLGDPFGSARHVEKVEHPIAQSYLDDMKVMYRESHAIDRVADELRVLAAPQATDPRDAEIERLKEKVVDLATALSIEHEATSNLLQLIGEERSARDTAESRIATLTAERDSLKELLDECHAKKRLQYERMDEVCEAVIVERDALRADVTRAVGHLLSYEEMKECPGPVECSTGYYRQKQELTAAQAENEKLIALLKQHGVAP